MRLKGVIFVFFAAMAILAIGCLVAQATGYWYVGIASIFALIVLTVVAVGKWGVTRHS